MLSTTNLQGVTVSLITPPNAPPMVAPCWTQTKGWMLFAHHPSALSRLMDRMNGKGATLAANTEFQTYSAGLPQKTYAMSFMSRRLMKVYGEVMTKAMQDQPGAPPGMPQLLEGIFSSYEKQMGMVSVGEQTEDGVRTTIQGPFNYSVSLASVIVVVPAVVAAVALPAVTQARTAAQRAACMNNLRQIRTAMLQWRLENSSDTVPADMDALKSYFADESLPVCPQGGVYGLPENGSHEPTCSHPGHFLEPQVRATDSNQENP